MRYQSKPYLCGPASIQNALRALGVRVGQERIAQLCQTSPDGTDESDLRRGLELLWCAYDELCTSDTVVARAWLTERLAFGRPVILCVDSWQHWIAVIGLLGARSEWRAVIADSAVEPYNRDENGVHVVPRERLMRRWQAGRRTAGRAGSLYAVAILAGPAVVPGGALAPAIGRVDHRQLRSG